MMSKTRDREMMVQQKNHDYEILAPSIWPLVGGVSAFIMLFGTARAMHGASIWIAVVGLIGVLYTMWSWWSDVIGEARAGEHTPVVRIGLRYGFVLFIISEVMFFAAWFWTFFKHALYPGGPAEPAMYNVWPPVGVHPFDPWGLPLINTLILLCSGAAATWAHHSIAVENNRKGLVNGLILAIVLGISFTVFQGIEYSDASFSFAGNIFGATFFMATGFHGAHVIIGTIFLTVCLVRALKGQFTPDEHVGLEAAVWYWHFVDVVWLFLFSAIYVWGSS